MLGVMKNSLRQRVLRAVEAGASTKNQILARVGRSISAASAISAGRKEDAAQKARNRRKGRSGRMEKKRTHDDLVLLGRSLKVGATITRLLREGWIRGVSRGVYAPMPKIHEPPKEVG